MGHQKINMLKVKISFSSVFRVLKKPQYLLIAFFSTIFMGVFIVWALNFDLLVYVLSEAPIGVGDKFSFLLDGYVQIFTSLDNGLSRAITVFTILFGINIASLTYVFKNQGLKNVPKKSGSTAFILAILGGGCIVCGTSILSPLLVTIGATSSLAVQGLSSSFNWLGSLLLIYSIYRLGLIASTIFAKKYPIQRQ